MSTSVDSDTFCSSLGDAYPSASSRGAQEYNKYLGPCLFGSKQVSLTHSACRPEGQRPRSSGQISHSRQRIRQAARVGVRRIRPISKPVVHEVRVENSGSDSLDLQSMVLHGSRLQVSPEEVWRMPACPHQSAEDSLLTMEESAFPFECLPEPSAGQESAQEPKQWQQEQPEHKFQRYAHLSCASSVASVGEVVSEISGPLSPASGNRSQLASPQEQPEQKCQRQVELSWASVVDAEAAVAPEIGEPVSPASVNTTQLVFLGQRSLSASHRGRLGISTHPLERSASTGALHRSREISHRQAASLCVGDSTSLTVRGTHMGSEAGFEPVTAQASLDRSSATGRLGWTKLGFTQSTQAPSSVILDHAKLVKHAPPLGCSLEQVLFKRRHISVKACNTVSSRPSTPSPGIPWRQQSQQQSAQALQELELVRRRPPTPTIQGTRPLTELTMRLQNEGPEIAARCD